MNNVFLSYSRQDSELVEEFARALRQENLNVWRDYESIQSGQNVQDSVLEALAKADAVVVFLSANSASSKFVQEEAQSALRTPDEKLIIPVLLDSSAKDNFVWPLVADRQAIDLSDVEKSDKRLQELGKSVGKSIGLQTNLHGAIRQTMSGLISSSEHVE